ncbi:hypothetical protein [Sinorhizobium phage phiM5]|jgi:hypothetical protein|nr:hypothetical protein [Sinorhizobium phage phiM5]
MTDKLTGRRRYRVARRFLRASKIVLQVEVIRQETDYAGGFVHSWKHAFWRDATLEDLSVFEWTE